MLSFCKVIAGVAAASGVSALSIHAQDISAELQGVLDTLEHALDLSTCEVLDGSSERLGVVRVKRRENTQQLQQEIDHWCRCLPGSCLARSLRMCLTCMVFPCSHHNAIV
jgi:hypothetical protein